MAEPPAKKLRTSAGSGCALPKPAASFAKDSLTEDPATWAGQPIVSVEQITPAGLQLVMDFADRCKHLVERTGGGHCKLLEGKIMAAVFYEASTRTNCSFQAAMMRLGGQVIPVNSQFSSAKKGETLSDTIRCLECYCDVLVLRHPVVGSAAEAGTVYPA